MDGALCRPLRVHAVFTAEWFPCLIYRAVWKIYFFSFFSRLQKSLRVSKHICALKTNISSLIASGICKQTHATLFLGSFPEK